MATKKGGLGKGLGKGLDVLIQANDEVLEMLKQGQIPNIFNRRGRKIIESMITPETFTGEYAIQYIKNAKSYRKSIKV